MHTIFKRALVVGAFVGVAISESRAIDAEFLQFGSTGVLTNGQSISAISSTTLTSSGDFPVVDPGQTRLTARVGFNVNADAHPPSGAIETGGASFQVGFAIRHFQAFDLFFDFQLKGQLRRSEDDPACRGQAVLNDIGFPTLRRLSDGALFPIDDATTGEDVILTGETLLFGFYNSTIDIEKGKVGIVRFRNQLVESDSYIIEFVVSGGVFSQSCEVSARFGADNGSTLGCSACEYPGDGERVLADDGIFVTVSLLDYCGDNAVDAGEACDLGPLNGDPSSCCDDSCRLVGEGRTCRAAADDCDKVEVCDGAAGACPEDARKVFGSFCTDDQNGCTDDVCNDNSVCVHIPLEGVPCEDDLFCDGAELCSAQGQCSVVIPACTQGQTCDEETDSCLQPTSIPAPTSTDGPAPTATSTATSTNGSSPTPTSTPRPTLTSTGLPTSTPSSSATALPGICPGDCDGSKSVEVDELILGVNIALGKQAASVCTAFDGDRNGGIAIDELVAGVNKALAGCD